MEISEEDTMLYIHFSKKQIDDYILKNEYQLAFHSLIFVLGRLDNDYQKDFIIKKPLIQRFILALIICI